MNENFKYQFINLQDNFYNDVRNRRIMRFNSHVIEKSMRVDLHPDFTKFFIICIYLCNKYVINIYIYQI